MNDSRTIDLYTWGTPNGRKASIMLEACQLSYRAIPINIGTGEQHAASFLQHSPNNRIPAIHDPDGPDGQPISVFESGAILIYLAEKCGRYLPEEPRAKSQVLQWLMWQMGGFGPMLGQAHHFRRFAKEKLDYPIERYSNEAQRLYRVLNTQLEGREFVCDTLSIADFAIYPWACRHEWQGINTEDFPAVHNWMVTMASIDAVDKGMKVPDSN